MGWVMRTPYVAGLLRAAAFDHRADDLVLRDTDISWVILAGGHAYKLKKPVDLGFVDFSTRERRLADCNIEVELSRRLCPDVYLGVVQVVASMALVSQRRLTAEILLQMALALTLVVPFVTTKMQDRYFFPADVLSVVYAFYNPKRFYIPIVVTTCSLLSYSPFLFKQTLVPLQFVSLAMLVPIALVLYQYACALFAADETARGHRSSRSGG
jgi:hypothetical protein